MLKSEHPNFSKIEYTHKKTFNMIEILRHRQDVYTIKIMNGLSIKASIMIKDGKAEFL